MSARPFLLIALGVLLGAAGVLVFDSLRPAKNKPELSMLSPGPTPPVQQGPVLSFDEEKGDFILFLHDFSTDTMFQFEHIEWPLVRLGLNADFDIETTWVARGEWHFADVGYCRNYMPVIHASFARNYPNTGERIVSWYGRETGENFSYYFRRSNQSWQLVRYEDFGG